MNSFAGPPTFDPNQQPAPLGGYRTAAATSLGRLVGESKWGGKPAVALIVLIVICGLVAVGAGIGAGATDFDSDDFTAALAISLSFGAITAALMFAYFFQRGTRVTVHEEGVIWSRRAKSRTFRFDDVVSLLVQITRQYVNGIYTGTFHLYTLVRGDGEKLRLTHAIKDIETLGPYIEEQVMIRQWPAAVKIFDAGGAVAFGGYSVSPIGISNGKETLRWDEIESITVQQGFFRVKKRGKFLAWASAMCGGIPNFRVMYALINRRFPIAG